MRKKQADLCVSHWCQQKIPDISSAEEALNIQVDGQDNSSHECQSASLLSHSSGGTLDQKWSDYGDSHGDYAWVQGHRSCLTKANVISECSTYQHQRLTMSPPCSTIPQGQLEVDWLYQTLLPQREQKFAFDRIDTYCRYAFASLIHGAPTRTTIIELQNAWSVSSVYSMKKKGSFL